MKPEEILKLIQDKAPPSFKYAITLAPEETDNIEKVLKRRQATSTPFSGKEEVKRQKVSMDVAVLTCPKYQAKLKDQKKAKEDLKEARAEKKKSKEAPKQSEETAKQSKNQKKKTKPSANENKQSQYKNRGKQFQNMLKSMVCTGNDRESNDEVNN